MKYKTDDYKNFVVKYYLNNDRGDRYNNKYCKNGKELLV